jgi:protein involved in polysaccharide export with SLBB domain
MARFIPLAPLALVTSLMAVSFARGAAQTTPSERSGHRLTQSRPELEERLRGLEGMARTGQYERGASRDFVRAETTYIRQRLEEGDFHVGDRILIEVEGAATAAMVAAVGPAGKSTEQQLSDTFTVGASQELMLPTVGAVSLRGLLRSELEPRLTVEIAGYIRDPVVHARALVGLAVSGELTRPGYYSVPADAVIPAVLMAAGGTTHEARLNKMKIQRNGQTIWEGDALRRAIAGGSTLDDLGLHPGDAITVPRGGSITGLYGPAQLVAVLLGIPVTIYTLTKIIH